ncbi:MAG: hypothetical protein HY660_09090 [Armatimonadetes bacterium]|nr:hypothetical protein [Armatimonadota bacterium]
MNARAIRWGLALLMVAALVHPTLAFVPRAGDNVVVGENIQDDLYAGGGTVTVSGTVDGDVAAAGGTVTLEGQVTGSVLAAGGTLKIGGATGRNLRAAAGMLDVEAQVATDALLAGGTVNVGRAARIGRDLVAGGGNLQIAGTVKRNALLGGGNVLIGGTIEGDAEIRADRIILLPTARIGGKLRYWADQPADVRPGAQVSGGLERLTVTPRPPRVRRSIFPLRLPFLGRFLEALWLLVLGFAVFAIAPRPAAGVVGEVRSRLGRSMLAGFILLVTVPVAAVLALVTIVGIPLSAVAILLYLATLYPGTIFVTAWLGEVLLRRFRTDPARPPSPYWALTVGTLVLVLLFGVPFAGWVIRVLAILIGFGAVWLAAWQSVTSRPAASQISPPAVA